MNKLVLRESISNHLKYSHRFIFCRNSHLNVNFTYVIIILTYQLKNTSYGSPRTTLGVSQVSFTASLQWPGSPKHKFTFYKVGRLYFTKSKMHHYVFYGCVQTTNCFSLYIWRTLLKHNDVFKSHVRGFTYYRSRG